MVKISCKDIIAQNNIILQHKEHNFFFKIHVDMILYITDLCFLIIIKGGAINTYLYNDCYMIACINNFREPETS